MARPLIADQVASISIVACHTSQQALPTLSAVDQSVLPAADLQTLAKLIPAQSRMVLNPESLGETPNSGPASDMDLAMVPTSNIRPGDAVRVLPGERMPVDGDIIEGKCSVDESMLTGESVPVPKIKGQQVCVSVPVSVSVPVPVPQTQGQQVSACVCVCVCKRVQLWGTVCMS